MQLHDASTKLTELATDVPYVSDCRPAVRRRALECINVMMRISILFLDSAATAETPMVPGDEQWLSSCFD